MGSIDTNLLPASTGLALGNQNQLWTAYLQDVFASTIVSNSLSAATSGTIRLASSDSIVWRDSTGSNDLALSKTGVAVGTVPADILGFPNGILGPFVSASASPASTGTVRLSDADTIVFRNHGDNGDVVGLQHNADDSISLGATLNVAGITDSGNAGISGNATIDGNLEVGGTSKLPAIQTDAISISTLGGIVGTSLSITAGNGTSGGGSISLVAGRKIVGGGFLGTVDLNTVIGQYKGITTVGHGVPYQVATADLTGQTGTVNTTALYTPTAAGMFRVLTYIKITTTGTSPVLGPVVISFTDAEDSVAQNVTMALVKETGAVATTNNGNATNTILSGSLIIWAKASAAISYGIGTSGTFGTAAYEAHFRLEALG